MTDVLEPIATAETADTPISRFRPYPEYKDSGVEWLGDVPSGWETRRLKNSILSIKNGVWGEDPSGVDEIACIRVADFDRIKLTIQTDDFTIRSVAPQALSELKLMRGNLLIEKSGGGEGQPVGTVVLFDADLDAVCSNFIAKVVVDPKFNPRFLCYLHSHLYSTRINLRSVKQTTGIQNLDHQHYFNNVVAYPSSDEQNMIASFLDRETAKIDALIAKKERFIELLEEQRSAVISHAVTKGLDPNVPMKDSGAEWIGEVPAHWDVRPLKHISPSVVVGIVVTPAKYYEENGVPCLRSLNIREQQITSDNLVFISDQSNLLHNKSILREGDIVAVRTGQPGTSAVVDSRFEGANCIDLILIRKSDLIDSSFLAYTNNSEVARVQFDVGSGGAIQQHFNVEMARNLLITLPPLDEQQEITEYLRRRGEDHITLTAKLRTAISRLREYRTALISAAVTGKIDVRGEVTA